jgi:hypothetical protein
MRRLRGEANDALDRGLDRATTHCTFLGYRVQPVGHLALRTPAAASATLFLVGASDDKAGRR